MSENNKALYIECKVVQNDYELPICICQCNSENIIISEENPTTAVRKMLSAIKSIGKKKWSGYDFFGFVRKNVSSHLKAMLGKKQQEKTSFKGHEVLKKALAQRKYLSRWYKQQQQQIPNTGNHKPIDVRMHT